MVSAIPRSLEAAEDASTAVGLASCQLAQIASREENSSRTEQVQFVAGAELSVFLSNTSEVDQD